MNVSEAVASRRSIRAFLDKPVEARVLREVLEKAQRAASGGNLQPWHGVILSGEPLERLKAHIAAVLPEGRSAWEQDYVIYPEALADPYEARRVAVGEAMYGAMGIAREDKRGRLAQFVANFRAFDAPVLMLVHMPRYMGPPQWSDIGMWLQTVMLLLREQGLDSCAQEAWSVYHSRIREVVGLPDDHLFFCGLAIGYRDPDAAVNLFDVARAPLEEAIRFEGF
ncbi:nitroreductase [Tsuneonella sp. CC-YZS046]|uniref:nitroreductase n=1 Tax=Tsuneonella sp. CC-YZS046 TaxID=3042152 RepID=UPI002D7A0EF5|nr:nitroreductase [Tsuneonella sp. CC-YZS046]WRO65089.1 nitroreductase [Tsuneonella sp. CC-YZS046]